MSHIQSVSYEQDYIINSIMELCNIQQFDADLTYGNGGFWNPKTPKPQLIENRY